MTGAIWLGLGLACVTKPVDVPDTQEDTGGRDSSLVDSGADSADTGETRDTGDSADSDGPVCADLPWTQVVAGVWLACGVHTDGCAECWAHEPWSDGVILHPDTGTGEVWNDYGDEYPPRDAFNQIDLVNYWGGANGGAFHGCGVRSDGTLACWGRNEWGESDAPAGTFQSVAVAEEFSCALDSTGSAICWGGAFGESYDLGVSLVSLSAGRDSVGGLDASGAAWTWRMDVDTIDAFEPLAAWAWIDVTWTNCTVDMAGAAWCWASPWDPGSVDQEGPFSQVCHGGGYACGLDLDGRASCWGSLDPWHAEFPEATYASLSCGWNLLCGLTEDGEAACVGNPWSVYDPVDYYRPPGSYVRD